nr:MAG TPA: hypothetical protein [Caudoviricetes sp.]
MATAMRGKAKLSGEVQRHRCAQTCEGIDKPR